MPAPGELPASIAALAGRNAVRLEHESFAPDNERLMRAIERSQRASSASRPPSVRDAPTAPHPRDEAPRPRHSLGIRIGWAVSFVALIAASYTVGASILSPGGHMSFAEGAPFAAILVIISVSALTATFRQVFRQRARGATPPGSAPSLSMIYVMLVAAALLPALLGSLDR